ncbi:MAG: hypothetical protein AAB791_01080 [Patescibacteria group bacterium]
MVSNALKIIRRIFPYGTCKPGSGKPCFDRQIGLCPGSCTGETSKKDYQKNIQNIILLLSGEKKRLLSRLKKENPDKIKALDHLADVSLIVRDEEFSNLNRIECYDISHLSGKEVYGAMSVFVNGNAEKKDYRLFKIRGFTNNDSHSLGEMIERRFKHLEWSRPDLVVIDGGRPQIDYIDKVFHKLNLNMPLVGISKFAGDKLVFPPRTGKNIQELAENSKNILLKARDEAHRFGLKASRRKRDFS